MSVQSGAITMKYKSVIAASLLVLMPLASAQAGIVGVNIFNNISYNQTSALPPAVPAGYYFQMGINIAADTDFDSASVTYPGSGSPLALTKYTNVCAACAEYFGGSLFYTNRSGLQAAYPFGTYTFTANNSITGTSQTAPLVYSQDLFTSTIPALDAASYTALQGMDSSQTISIAFNTQVANPLAPTQFTFFTIYDLVDNSVAFSASFLNPSISSLSLNGMTLQANRNYSYELIFDNRTLSAFDPVSRTFSEQSFGARTNGRFRTAAAVVPEPASITLFGAGIVGLFAARRKAVLRKKIMAR
jgi:hypothetical protein